jgi:hypothetical protein
LLPILGAPLLISVNAVTFIVVALAVAHWRPRQEQTPMLRENFTESFISSLRYARAPSIFPVTAFAVEPLQTRRTFPGQNWQWRDHPTLRAALYRAAEGPRPRTGAAGKRQISMATERRTFILMAS